jgi:TatD DNase family protein
MHLNMSNLRYDAHCHLSNPVHVSPLEIQRVVNGTQPSDWSEILIASKQDSQIIPAIGLHPWHVNKAPADWKKRFLQYIPQAKAVGEIGLDQWVENTDIERQTEAFSWQLQQASERNLPVSIHCLKASAPLLQILKNTLLPKRGIHLHAYSSSAEQIAEFTEFKTYFSFNTKQFRPNAKRVLAAVRLVPADRILIETDAPDTLQPGESQANALDSAYTQIANLREMSRQQLIEQVAENFQRYFITSNT